MGVKGGTEQKEEEAKEPRWNARNLAEQMGDPDDAGKTRCVLGLRPSWATSQWGSFGVDRRGRLDRGGQRAIGERESVINADLPASKSKSTTDVTLHPYPSFLLTLSCRRLQAVICGYFAPHLQ